MKTRPGAVTFSLVVGLGLLSSVTTPAATPGLPFTEDFTDDALKDRALTNANWSTEEQALALAWRKKRFGAFGPGLTGSDITTDLHLTWSVAFGDVDGDGDLDLVAGNDSPDGLANRLYLNNGTADPWNGVIGSNITTDSHHTLSVALGDVDGDGDLDLVAGNNHSQPNRLYLNNGTANPWNDVTGSNITTDTNSTWSVALGDVDGDGDLDLVAGNYGEVNRLYLNNGTTDPFNGVSGSNITSDSHFTWSVALGDVDGDGDLDFVAGNGGLNVEANRLYLNNGTTDPFNGVSGSDITSDSHFTRSVVLGDVDGDRDLDLVTGNVDRNRLYLNNGTADPFQSVTGSDITADSDYTYSADLGDVDGDGDLDLVTGNMFGNRLYLNNGTADPWFGVIGSDITTDNHNTMSVSLVDVDGDNDLDLVAGNSGARGPNRLYLNSGTHNPWNGVTGADVTADSDRTSSVALGDVDGDGDFDLVEGGYYQVNRLYLNNGTSDPWNGVSGTDITAGSFGTLSVALGDVDGDGDLDLVTGNLNQVNRLYLNNGTMNPWNGVSGSDITADSNDTWSVVLGDVDGDGDLDLVAGNWQQVNRLYLNNGTADPWNGVTGIDIAADMHATHSLALGDVDGDGDLDLVAGNWEHVNRLYLNNGTANPWNGVTGADITTDSDETYSVVLGDVDADGDLDLIAGNSDQTNRLYLNNGTADPWNGVTGSDITTDSNDTRSAALEDLDGDGDLDLVVGNASYQTNRLYLNNGTADPWNGVTGSDITADALITMSVAVGDVDADGDYDLVAGNWEHVNRLSLNGDTADPWNGIVGSGITSDSHFTDSVALGDVDGDGDFDLVAGNYGAAAEVNRLYLNNGTSDPWNGVAGSGISSDSHFTRSVALGDVDGDGDLDLVAGNWDATNRLYLNNGTTDPWNGVSGSDISADSDYTHSVVLGDVDGDGDLDLVAGNAYQTNRLYLNDGTADPWSGVVGSDITADNHQTYVAVLGDVDGDGDLDLVTGNAYQTNRLYLNNGTADPWSGVIGSDITSDSNQTFSAVLGDVDGDGDLDLVAGNRYESNRLYLNNGTADPWGGVSGSDITADSDPTFSVALGDIDGDGDLDLVAGNHLFGTNRLYLNNGTADPFSGISGVDINADDLATWSVALWDVDGDGNLDLVAGNEDQPNRLYQRRSYQTAHGRAVSLRVDDHETDIGSAALTATEYKPVNTGITYWMSNNGGARWFIVKSGAWFGFPTTGHDLRWKAELSSLSPAFSPRLDLIEITAPQVTLITGSGTGGSITDPGEGTYTYNEGSIVPIVAVADSGFVFANWTGSGSSAIANVNSPNTTITMDDSFAIQANFIPVIFADGFESGDLSMWSFSSP